MHTQESPQTDTSVTRRRFFAWVGWGSFAAFWGGVPRVTLRYALIAISTHLGCTPNWFTSDQLFRRPCHGSVFWLDGTSVAGPAPVPLLRAAIALAATRRHREDRCPVSTQTRRGGDVL